MLSPSRTHRHRANSPGLLLWETQQVGLIQSLMTLNSEHVAVPLTTRFDVKRYEYCFDNTRTALITQRLPKTEHCMQSQGIA